MTTNIPEYHGHRSNCDPATIADRTYQFRQLENSRTPWIFGLLVIVAGCVFLPASSTHAQVFSQSAPTTGSSHRDLKMDAISAIPMDRLTPEAQQKISKVVENPSLYRQLPSSSIETDPDMFILLARYPEIVVEIWKLMGVSQMQCQRTGPFTIRSDDGAGTASELELVYGTESIHVFYGTGTYSGNLIRRSIDADCVLVLRTAFGRAPNGGTTANSTLDVFMKIDNAVVGLAAKTVLPLVGKTADHNFVETLRFVERLNNTTENNGPGVQGMAYKLEGLTPDVRQQFVETAGLVYERAVQRATSMTQPSQQYAPSVSITDYPGSHSGNYNR
jgi:hypothetical protein